MCRAEIKTQQPILSPPVETRNPHVLGSLEPTPKEQLRRAYGWSPLDWIPNRGVQGEPVQKILRSTHTLAGQVSSLTNAVSSCSSTTTTRGRGVCPFWGEHSPSPCLRGWLSPQNHLCLTVYGVGGPHQITAPSISDHCVAAAPARDC